MGTFNQLSLTLEGLTGHLSANYHHLNSKQPSENFSWSLLATPPTTNLTEIALIEVEIYVIVTGSQYKRYAIKIFGFIETLLLLTAVFYNV